MTTNVKAFLTDVNRDGFHEVAEAIRAAGGKDAEHISYDNSVSGLEADNVQAAIDEVAGDVSDLETAVSGKVSKSGDTMTGKLTVNNDVVITGDLSAPFAHIVTLNYRDPLTDKVLNVIAPNVINVGGTLQFPDKGGTLALISDIPKGHILTLPTSGYTSGSVSIWGDTLTLYSITLDRDKDGNYINDFVSGMIEDYPVNVDGSAADFNKLYAFSIGNGNVTFYLTSAPSTAFNVLIKEAI